VFRRLNRNRDRAIGMQGVDDKPEYHQPDSRRRQRTVVRGRVLVVIAFLLAGVAILGSDPQTQLVPKLAAQWQAILVIGGAALLLIGMVTARPGGVLAGPLISAVGAAFLLEERGYPANLTLLAGLVMVAVGLGIVVRGLTLARD
jgi:hypothetical protein